MEMKIKIKKDRAVAFFLMLASLNLPLYDYIGGIISVINDLLRVMAVLGVGYMVIKKRAAKFTPIFVFLVLMQAELFISTLINSGSIWDWFTFTCSLFAVALIFEVWSHDIKELVFALMPLMELLCYANYLTVLIFPNGLYTTLNEAGWGSSQNWLFGYRTVFINYVLPACLIAFFYQQFGGKRWRTWGVYIVSLIMVALPPSRSATSAIGLTVFLLMLYVICRGFKFNVYLLVGINITLFFVVVVFRLHEVFLGLIGQIFAKNIVTLSGRTLLWDNLFQAVKEKPLFGYGVLTNEQSVSILKLFYGSNGHNIILHYLYQGGAIQIALYLCMMIVIYRRLRKVQWQLAAQAISAALFTFQIIGITEPLQIRTLLYMLYYFAYFAEQISVGKLAKEEKIMLYKAERRKSGLFKHWRRGEMRNE